MTLTQTDHRQWLQTKLSEQRITNSDLVRLVIAVEQTVKTEYYKVLGHSPRIFFRITDKTGTPTRTWLYAAELALWLAYRQYDPQDWVRFLCSQNRIRFMMRKNIHISLSYLIPLTRISRDQITKLDQEYQRWKIKH